MQLIDTLAIEKQNIFKSLKQNLIDQFIKKKKKTLQTKTKTPKQTFKKHQKLHDIRTPLVTIWLEIILQTKKSELKNMP